MEDGTVMTLPEHQQAMESSPDAEPSAGLVSLLDDDTLHAVLLQCSIRSLSCLALTNSSLSKAVTRFSSGLFSLPDDDALHAMFLQCSIR